MCSSGTWRYALLSGCKVEHQPKMAKSHLHPVLCERISGNRTLSSADELSWAGSVNLEPWMPAPEESHLDRRRNGGSVRDNPSPFNPTCTAQGFPLQILLKGNSTTGPLKAIRAGRRQIRILTNRLTDGGNLGPIMHH